MELKKSAQQAILWSAGLNIFRDALQFVQMIVLTRLLDPAIYGKAGLTTTLINYIGVISFQHIIPHVLQVRDNRLVNYHEHFSAGLVINGSLFLLTNLIGFGASHISNYSDLQPLIHTLSISFLLSVPADMRIKMLERDHNWSRLRILQMLGIVISISAGITMALNEAGVYALIVPGLLASSVFLFDLFLGARWWPQWQWNYKSYREALRFGLSRAGSNTLNGGRYFLQNILITQFFSFSVLGIFGRSEGLAVMFCQRIAQEVSNSLYPVITRADAQSERFQRISGLVLRCVSWVVMPIAAFFSLEAANIIGLVYGDKWLEVIPILPFAMLISAAVSIAGAAYRLLLANNQIRFCLRSDFIAFLMAVSVMLLLIPQGLSTYLKGAFFVNMMIALMLISLLIKTRGLRFRCLAKALIPPVVAVGIASLCSLEARNLMDVYLQVVDIYLQDTNLSIVFRTLLSWLLFTTVYISVLRIFFRAPLAEIMTYLPGGRRLGGLLRV